MLGNEKRNFLGQNGEGKIAQYPLFETLSYSGTCLMKSSSNCCVHCKNMWVVLNQLGYHSCNFKGEKQPTCFCSVDKLALSIQSALVSCLLHSVDNHVRNMHGCKYIFINIQRPQLLFICVFEYTDSEAACFRD